jgi:hypothetical protein
MVEGGAGDKANWKDTQTNAAVKVSHSPCKECTISLPMTSLQVSTSALDMIRLEHSVEFGTDVICNFCTTSNTSSVPWMAPFNLSRRNRAIALLLSIGRTAPA